MRQYGVVSDLVHVLRAGGALPVERWLPPSGTGPGLLVIQEIFGVSGYIRQRCADFAAAGYVVYAPELYFRQGKLEFDSTSASYVHEGSPPRSNSTGTRPPQTSRPRWTPCAPHPR